MTIDLTRPGGDRVTCLKLRCNNDCKSDISIKGVSYETLVPEKDYAILAPSYIVNGGDGYKTIKQRQRKKYEGIA